MQSYLPIYNDVVNQVLVVGLQNPARWSMPSIGKGSNLRLKYFPLAPTNRGASPFFTQLEIDSLSLRVQIGAYESVLAYQETWTKQLGPDTLGQSNYFYADLDCNTTELNAAIGSSAYFDTLLEVQLNDNGWRKTLQQQVRIINFVRDPTGASDLPSLSNAYLTKAQADNQFVKWTGNAPGAALVLVSPNGGYSTALFTDDNGVFHADTIVTGT